MHLKYVFGYLKKCFEFFNSSTFKTGAILVYLPISVLFSIIDNIIDKILMIIIYYVTYFMVIIYFDQRFNVPYRYLIFCLTSDKKTSHSIFFS